MSQVPIYKPQDEMALMKAIWSPEIAQDPYAFVLFVFPWGKQGTPLEHHKGPRRWQAKALQRIRDHIREQTDKQQIGLTPTVLRKAFSAGRGPGKSTLAAWLILWMMSCNLGSTTIVTANTEAQLKTRTWAELGKWHTLALNSHWFDKQALSLKPAPWFEDLLKKQLKIDTGYYYAQAQLWSEENPDAFAGAHNPHGMLVIYDEASGIPQPIWTVTEGFFTEPVIHRYWFVFSNPRRNTGAFFECFHRHRDSWEGEYLDAREIEGTDREVLEGIIRQYGVDSDEARIEVYGQFPRQGDKQFISRAVVDAAVERELIPDEWAPLIMGVDVARYGDDKSVIRFRRGRDARSIPAAKFKGLDNMQLAYKVAELAERYKPDAICIDAGNGTGVIDRLREMKFRVHEVWFGAKSPEPEWANQGTHLWAQMREWLRGGCIDSDQQLVDDLTAREYKFRSTSDVIMLESKEELKDRGFASPDDADALACTFAVKVPRLDAGRMRRDGYGNHARVARDVDYDVFSGR